MLVTFCLCFKINWHNFRFEYRNFPVNYSDDGIPTASFASYLVLLLLKATQAGSLTLLQRGDNPHIVLGIWSHTPPLQLCTD